MENEIIFDEKSGISVEEQKEILSQINGIAEQNRSKLSENVPNKAPVTSSKKGIAFPLIVNISAVVILCLGAVLLIALNSRNDAQVRTGKTVYNFTERALIDEIRKDTADLIAAKEAEIEGITSRMEEIDRELLGLYSSNVTLNTEQIAARERLLAAQTSFRDELSVLNNERSQILESSRAREARLRAQLEERTREFAAAQQQASGELESALSDLNKLSNEQDKIASIDAHFFGGIASINALMQKNQYDQAATANAALREFVNTSFSQTGITFTRSFQPRREYYNQTISLMETMIADARKNSGAGNQAEQLELHAKNSQLQETINEMQSVIDGFSRGSAGQTQRVTELESRITVLSNEKTTLEQSSAQKDRTISTLQNENASIGELRATITNQEQRITDLNNQLAAIRQLLSESN